MGVLLASGCPIRWSLPWQVVGVMLARGCLVIVCLHLQTILVQVRASLTTMPGNQLALVYTTHADSVPSAMLWICACVYYS